MKGMFKRALAGVAAAALAATGLALAAGSASAAPTESITIVNSQTDSTYSAYRFAEFGNYRATDTHINTVDVTTDTDVLDKVKDAVEATGVTVEAPYTTNPAALVATFDDATLREFADAFVFDNLTADGTVQGTDGQDVTIDGLEPGWYLVHDSQGKMMVVTSTIGGYQTMTINGLQETLGRIVAKSNTPTKPVKTADEVNQALGVGSTVHYTVKWDLPNVAGYDPATVTYILRDKPSKGLTVAKSDVKIYVADENGTLASTTEGFGWLPPSVKVTEITLDGSKFGGFTDSNDTMVGDGQKTFTIDLSDWIKADANAKYAGATLYVRYGATINGDVQSNPTVTNEADVTQDPDEEFTGDTTTTVKIGKFEFTKYGVDADAAKLVGATFKVWAGTKAGDDDAALKFTKSAVSAGADGQYVYDADNATAGASAEIKSGADGKVVVNGLPAGDYTVKETIPASGYATQFMPTFTVTVKADGTWELKSADTFGLATGTTDIRVKNVKLITQLPMTGAAGTALFTVLGLLIAGAGALVYMKSRNVKHALRG